MEKVGSTKMKTLAPRKTCLRFRTSPYRAFIGRLCAFSGLHQRVRTSASRIQKPFSAGKAQALIVFYCSAFNETRSKATVVAKAPSSYKNRSKNLASVEKLSNTVAVKTLVA